MQIVKIQRNSKYKWNNRIWWRWWISCGRKAAQRLSRIPLQRINNMCITLSRPFTWSWTPQNRCRCHCCCCCRHHHQTTAKNLIGSLLLLFMHFRLTSPVAIQRTTRNKKKLLQYYSDFCWILSISSLCNIIWVSWLWPFFQITTCRLHFSTR